MYVKTWLSTKPEKYTSCCTVIREVPSPSQRQHAQKIGEILTWFWSYPKEREAHDHMTRHREMLITIPDIPTIF